MKPLSFPFAVLLLGLALPAQAQAPVPYRWSKPIDLGPIKNEEIVSITLDSDIFAATRAGLPDLRVVDDQNAEVPFQIEPDVEYRQERTRQSFDTQVVSLREEGKAIEIHLRLPDQSPSAEGLSFATPLVNYERQVRVWGPTDGRQWVPLVTSGIVFDYSRYMDVSNHDIPLPSNSFRDLKVVIEDVSDENQSPLKELTRTFRAGRENERSERTMVETRAFRIDRITAWHTVTQDRVRKVKTIFYPIVSFEPRDDVAKKETNVTVHTHREPITRFVLETGSRNFSRQAAVEVPVVQGVTTRWQPIAETTISNLHFRDQHREQLSIAIPERREEQFRIVIRNADNPPLNITDVKAEGNVDRVVFIAQPAKTYRLFYGSETALAPVYEAATVLQAVQQNNQPVMARLGAQAPNKEFAGESIFAARGLLNNWVFLGAAIGLMVIVLAWCLFRAGRRLEGLPKE
jgi:hypothetical protein